MQVYFSVSQMPAVLSLCKESGRPRGCVLICTPPRTHALWHVVRTRQHPGKLQSPPAEVPRTQSCSSACIAFGSIKRSRRLKVSSQNRSIPLLNSSLCIVVELHPQDVGRSRVGYDDLTHACPINISKLGCTALLNCSPSQSLPNGTSVLVLWNSKVWKSPFRPLLAFNDVLIPHETHREC